MSGGARRSVIEWRLLPFEQPGLLSRAERDIVWMLLSGQTIRDIALERGTSARTVRNQLSRIRGTLRRLPRDAGDVRRRMRHLDRCRAFWQRVLAGRLVVREVLVRPTSIRIVVLRPRRPRQLLTPREQEALALAAGGFRIKEISEDLGISAASADTYLRRALAKVHIADRTVLEVLSH